MLRYRTFPAMIPPLIVALALGTAVAGCRSKESAKPKVTIAPATRPWATDIKAETATVTYWLGQAANSEVSFGDFQKLWDSCESVAYDYLFIVARRDFRRGLLTTEPMVSKQWFEPWRKDASGLPDVEEASLGGIRRTIYFQFNQNPDGSYTVAPKVVVERQAKLDPQHTDEEATGPTNYWYALRRDSEMEVHIVADVRRRLEK
jgi:hypothetical protein